MGGNRDHTIKTLQDEIAEQDEVINKLNKEKKHLSATQAKSAEDLESAEEKVKHLNQVKSQLESTLDQLEGGFDKALDEKVKTFEKNCVNFLKVLDSAKAAAQKMTTHAEADAEVAGLKERYAKVKSVTDTWVKKVDVLVKEWVLLDNTVTE